MLEPHAVDFRSFVAWYRGHASQAIAEFDASRANEWAEQLDELEREAETPPPSVAMCFLGGSGVGKSTLINALAAGSETLLPAGGVGPLTAQALVVSYADQRRLTAHYHSAGQINRLIFGLEQSFAVELRATRPPAIGEGMTDGDARRIEDEAADESRGTRDREELRKQAQLLVLGHQERPAELPYLLASLRAVLNPQTALEPEFEPADSARITRLRRAVAAARENRPHIVGPCDATPQFAAELHDHAAGFLSPIIRDLEIEYPSDLLRSGATLVDLPGLGVAGDSYRKVTVEWVREKADAIVLVVDSRGIIESVAELLRTSEFLNRLLYSADHPAEDPVDLVIAVTRVDDVAAERRSSDRSRRKSEHFHDLKPAFRETIKSQLRNRLVVIQQQGDRTLSEVERQVINRVVDEVRIHPISAVEYRKLLEDEEDEDQPAFLQDPMETGVPGLQDDLRAIAELRRVAREERLRSRQNEFVDRVLKTLQAIVPAAHAIESELRQEETRLRESFRELLSEQTREYERRLAQFREFWKETLPVLIEKQVSDAQLAAAHRIRAYLATLSTVHPKTLQASVNYGGTFNGARRIDLPRDLANCFDGAIAERWGSQILQVIRRRTREFSDDCLQILREVHAWTTNRHCPRIAERLQLLVAAFEAETRKADQVGLDRTAEIRERVNHKLVQAVEAPIRAKCVEFRDQGRNEGHGVRGRILDLFQQLGDGAAEIAGSEALPLLRAAVDDTQQAIVNHPALARSPMRDLETLAEELNSEPTEESRRRIELGRRVEGLLELLEAS